MLQWFWGGQVRRTFKTVHIVGRWTKTKRRTRKEPMALERASEIRT